MKNLVKVYFSSNFWSIFRDIRSIELEIYIPLIFFYYLLIFSIILKFSKRRSSMGTIKYYKNRWKKKINCLICVFCPIYATIVQSKTLQMASGLLIYFHKDSSTSKPKSVCKFPLRGCFVKINQLWGRFYFAALLALWKVQEKKISQGNKIHGNIAASYLLSRGKSWARCNFLWDFPLSFLKNTFSSFFFSRVSESLAHY